MRWDGIEEEGKCPALEWAEIEGESADPVLSVPAVGVRLLLF
jgi:hypothetical protein